MNNTYFDDEDEHIFSAQDISCNPPSKDPRVVHSRCMEYFLAWLARYHPELQTISDLSLDEVKQLVNDFEYSEYSTKKCHNYTFQRWHYSLQRR